MKRIFARSRCRESYGRPLAVVILADPDQLSPSERDLAEFLGLSPAESPLAAALLAGKKLGKIAVVGVQVTTFSPRTLA